MLLCHFLYDHIFLCVGERDCILCFQVKSNDDLLAAMAGGNPASNSAVKTKRTTSIGTNASSLDGKPKTTSGISEVPFLVVYKIIFCNKCLLVRIYFFCLH